jgi:hypothetical protein
MAQALTQGLGHGSAHRDAHAMEPVHELGLLGQVIGKPASLVIA